MPIQQLSNDLKLIKWLGPVLSPENPSAGQYSNAAAETSYRSFSASVREKPDVSGDEMATLSREEVDAKLEAISARTETRFVELSSKMDRITEIMSDVKDDLRSVKADNKYTRWTIVITVVATAVAMLGVIYTTQGNLLTAFQTGVALQQVQPPTSSK